MTADPPEPNRPVVVPADEFVALDWDWISERFTEYDLTRVFESEAIVVDRSNTDLHCWRFLKVYWLRLCFEMIDAF
jgi:hypothetical protein